ncbi:transcription intermediary factor 1-beta-like [Watersipora subatra]|uniref:transcription intermediary factor 1-beta-like n=1 Tax=Watersipora subatra TaxID=2589382 RepID=UPI00355C4EED
MAAEGQNCGYCMLKLENMLDPRRLPCNHIFCFGCLQGDFTAGGVDTKCNQCGELHSGLALNELRIVEEGEENSDAGDGKFPPVACSKNCENKAISFCEDCSVKMCEENKKFPEKYDRPMCNSHNKGLSLVCETCDVVVCEEFDLTSPCNQVHDEHQKEDFERRKKYAYIRQYSGNQPIDAATVYY